MVDYSSEYNSLVRKTVISSEVIAFFAVIALRHWMVTFCSSIRRCLMSRKKLMIQASVLIALKISGA